MSSKKLKELGSAIKLKKARTGLTYQQIADELDMEVFRVSNAANAIAAVGWVYDKLKEWVDD